MLPRFLQSLHYNKILSTALGLCFFSTLHAQDKPLSTPNSAAYPGIIESFEKLIKVDAERFKNTQNNLIKNGRSFTDTSKISNLDLAPDFLNSIILHSDPGYIRLASVDKCRFYDTLITDLLKNADGKIRNVFVTYLNDKKERESAIISKKDFLDKVVNQECPESKNLISQFQIKALDKTLKDTVFEIPTGKDQCHAIHLAWLKNPKMPYLCQVYEYIKEARNGDGDPKDLKQRQAVAKVLEQKQSSAQKDYIENICTHLAHEDLFCEEFLNVSFWNKIANGHENKIYAEDICKKVFNTPNLSNDLLRQCLFRIKKENDICLYPAGRNQGLTPQPECDDLSLAMNYSVLRSNYQDCPAGSDQLGITNLGRILLNISKEPVRPYSGSCSVISTGEVFNFNNRFDNDENWKLEACYDDKINEKEVCYKTFFGDYGNLPQSYNNIVANILKQTNSAVQNLKCDMVDSQDYNPLLLQYRSGCVIIYQRNKCFMSQCEHKILYNDKPINYIRLKNRLPLTYFPTSIKDEKFSQQYLLTNDYKQKGRTLSNMTAITNFFKNSRRGVAHGIGCAEDLLPSFFKTQSLNQCSPLPFIIDGIIRDKDKVVFVTRTAADSLQAPRLIGWNNIFSSVKSYQRYQPLKIWTLYGFD